MSSGLLPERTHGQGLAKSCPRRRARPALLIPYRGIGSERGLLLGFGPDRVMLQSPAASVTRHRVVIALCEQAVCPDGPYRALVPPQMLDTG
ncbi:MAG TPA: hypothetical protein DCM14_00920 [Clostridiales bacterium UBA8153]|nr:hypothetical protein [Clostridiales bacterium UBA8153]